MNTIFKVIPIALLIFVFASPVHSQTFMVKAISQDLKEVLVGDRETGMEWIGRLGDEIEGWRIVEIGQAHVTLSRPGEADTVFVTRIPIMREIKLTIERKK